MLKTAGKVMGTLSLGLFLAMSCFLFRECGVGDVKARGASEERDVAT